MMIDTTGHTLLSIGRENWDYYHDLRNDRVISKAKPDSGAADTFYGSLEYYKKHINLETLTDHGLLDRIEAGESKG